VTLVGVVNADLTQQAGHRSFTLEGNGNKEVLGTDVFVLETTGFFFGGVEDSLQSGGYVDLHLSARAELRSRRAIQDVLKPALHRLRVDAESLQDLRHKAIALTDEGHQQVFNV
jgi:hypothetical protein